MDENRLIEQYGLHESLKFQTADGHIWFDQARMVLMHAATLGELRKELIDQLGCSSAKGILWRLGFRGGQMDARVAAKRATKADDYDSFRLGPAIHALEGMVKSDIVDLTICQSACKRDPLSARKRDPLSRWRKVDRTRAFALRAA